MRKRSILALIATLISPLPLPGLYAADYQDAKAPIEDRVNDLFGKLTPDEKLSLLTGTGFATPALPRLHVPEMAMADAGQGVRGGNDTTQGPATAFPSGVAMASTWDPELVSRIGKAIGEEARNKGTGVQVLLGPAVNIHRSPLGGRNGEYFSEDPFLAARMAVGYIQGMQSSGVAACIKHYACNNEEVDRNTVDVKVGERALREIYLPAFEAGVKEGKVWTLMSSYNLINGPHASANTYLLTDVLKKGWGFDGVVMSDWGGVHETPVAQAGNDLEMPGGEHATVPKLKDALKKGTLTQGAVDDSARRILRAIIRTGLVDGPMKPDGAMVNSKEHRALALEAATKGIVLLKNEKNLLPLDRKHVHSIAVIGNPAKDLQFGALGSPEVKPLHSTQIFDGIAEAAGKGIPVSYTEATLSGSPLSGADVTVPGSSQRGFKVVYFKGTRLEGTPLLERIENKIQMDTAASPAPGVPATNFSARWTGKLKAPSTGMYTFSFTGDDGFRVIFDGKIIIERWADGSATSFSATAELQAGHEYDLTVEYFQSGGDAVAKLYWVSPSEHPYAAAVAAAKKADVAVVCVSTNHTEGEGSDRSTMNLPNGQDELIRRVAAVNPHTVVVLNNGAPVTMKDWIAKVPAVIEAWFPGQEGGAALAAVLFGEVNPSGKLPDTFAVNRADYPDYGNFPGKDGKVNYAEGIYVGYRHFDKKDIAPVFPFGHGLSYTTFAYSDPKVSAPALQPDGTVTVSVDVTNTGKRAGEEVAQLYVRDLDPKIDKPVRELKGFSKIAIEPGETKTVQFTLKPRDFAYFDVPGKQWKADAGKYAIEIGASSRDIRQKIPLELGATFIESVPLSQDHSKG